MYKLNNFLFMEVNFNEGCNITIPQIYLPMQYICLIGNYTKILNFLTN